MEQPSMHHTWHTWQKQRNNEHSLASQLQVHHLAPARPPYIFRSTDLSEFCLLSQPALTRDSHNTLPISTQQNVAEYIKHLGKELQWKFGEKNYKVALPALCFMTTERTEAATTSYSILLFLWLYVSFSTHATTISASQERSLYYYLLIQSSD